jgi:hypothetical protein
LLFPFYFVACVAVVVVALIQEHPIMVQVVIMVEDTRNKAVDIMETIVVAAVAAFPMYSGASVVLNGAVEIVKIAMLCAMQLEMPIKEVKWYNDKSEEVEVNLKGEARLAVFCRRDQAGPSSQTRCLPFKINITTVQGRLSRDLIN